MTYSPSMLSDFFRRPGLWIPVVASVALLLAHFSIAKGGFDRLQNANHRIAVAQSREAQLAEYLRLTIDVETGQRGYLLTAEQRYLQPYQQAAPRLGPLLDALGDSYIRENDVAGLALIRDLRSLSGAKLMEIDATLRLFRERGSASALDLIKTDAGIESQNKIRSVIEKLRNSEAASVQQATATWNRDLRNSRWLTGTGTAINIVLLLIAAALLLRELRRRDRRVDALDEALRQRNVELAQLTSHVQRIGEIEKAALARELHDELGGLLVASKMDAVWLQRRLPNADAEVRLRLVRLAKMLDDGVDFKRRVVENLRPTLLDNLGLFAALKWMCHETCGRAGLHCEEQLPEEEPNINEPARIAIFRVAQEAFTNVLKHAEAKNITLRAVLDADTFTLTIADDGRGIAPGPMRLGSQGIAGMRHRVVSMGGTMSLESEPGTGTRMIATIPLNNIRTEQLPSTERQSA